MSKPNPNKWKTILPMITAFNATDPTSFRDKNVISPIEKTAKPTHCVTDRVGNAASLVKLFDSITSGKNIITKPKTIGISAAINKNNWRLIIRRYTIKRSG